MSDRNLVVIGAGPKAMALAAKNTVLEELGFEVPQIHIIEKSAIGANWNGCGGYTNGRMELGTSPEKDVGFPYQTRGYGQPLDSQINARMRAFSWQSFLVADGRYGEWIDRGRPSPTHAVWAKYLRWVWEQCGDSVHLHFGQVQRLDIVDTLWEVEYASDQHLHRLSAEGVVLTGPGKIRAIEGEASAARVLDVESFWKNISSISKSVAPTIGIVGAGENAASIALALSQAAPSALIQIVSPTGFIFSRGESFRENRVYTDSATAQWKALPLKERREFVKRTDLGVFSQYALKHLDAVSQIEIIPGRLTTYEAKGDKVTTTVRLAASTRPYTFDYMVKATGFDQSSTLEQLLTVQARNHLLAQLQTEKLTQSLLENRMEENLAVGGFFPRLHIPALAGLMQGPGFANLSCLGRLADQLLEPYLRGENHEQVHQCSYETALPYS
jgi:mycobactin lysine-N-oxygenase